MRRNNKDVDLSEFNLTDAERENLVNQEHRSFRKENSQMYNDKFINFMSKEIVPKVSEILKSKIDNIKIIAEFYAENATTIFKDKLIKEESLFKDVPIVYTTEMKKVGAFFSFSLKTFQAYGNPELKYCTLYFSDNSPGAKVAIIHFFKKGDFWKIKRNAIKMHKKALFFDAKEKPILDNTMLANIESEVIGFLNKAKKLQKYGVKMNRGIVLSGIPGSGKSMTCKYLQDIADKNDIDWTTVSSSDINKANVEGRLEDLFSEAEIIFFDDIDINYFNRSEKGEMSCSILSAMDGLSQSKNLIVRIFTTNESIDTFDPAFLRPGRIDSIFKFENPKSELRRRYIMSWNADIVKGIDVDNAVDLTDGYSFAEIAGIRSFTVQEYLNSGKWDFEGAVNKFCSYRTDKAFEKKNKGKKAGFI